MAFLVGAFEEKCPTLTVGSFSHAKVNFFVNLFNNLNYESSKHPKPQNLVKTKKNKTDVQNLENTLRIPLSQTPPPPTFFGTMQLFFEIFWIAAKSPFICFDILQHNACQKITKGPSCYIFRHCDIVQKCHFQFFGNFLKSPKGPLQFFPYFPTSWSFTKPKGSPFYTFEP